MVIDLCSIGRLRAIGFADYNVLVLRNIVIGSDMANMQSGMSVGSDLAVLGKSIKYAAIFITIAPILMVYPFIQKYFATGIMVGALKG